MLAVVCFSSYGQDNAADRPNVVRIFVDGMGWADLSYFANLATEAENIDRLATLFSLQAQKKAVAQTVTAFLVG